MDSFENDLKHFPANLLTSLNTLFLFEFKKYNNKKKKHMYASCPSLPYNKCDLRPGCNPVTSFCRNPGKQRLGCEVKSFANCDYPCQPIDNYCRSFQSPFRKPRRLRAPSPPSPPSRLGGLGALRVAPAMRASPRSLKRLRSQAPTASIDEYDAFIADRRNRGPAACREYDPNYLLAVERQLSTGGRLLPPNWQRNVVEVCENLPVEFLH
jgi:hypothetical protein